MSQQSGGVKTRAFKAAFPKVLPICISFFFLAMSYGVLMGTRGFSFLWPLCMSAFIYTGSMEFVTVNLLVSAFNPFATLMLALMMGTSVLRAVHAGALQKHGGEKTVFDLRHVRRNIRS